MLNSRRILNLVIAMTLGAILALAMTGPFYSRFEPATLFYEVNGVDISHHQGKIDWPELASDNVSFVFMKATEGDNFIDRRFKQNWRGAKEAGIKRGAYHFFTRCSSAEAQAKNFIATVPKEADSLPHVVDAEHMGPCKNGFQATQDMAGAIKNFLDITEAHYGKRPLIYTDKNYNEIFLKNKLPNERYWLRSLFIPPSFRKTSWLFWQHHHRARRKGIVGPVDLNVFRGTRQELEELSALPIKASN